MLFKNTKTKNSVCVYVCVRLSMFYYSDDNMKKIPKFLYLQTIPYKDGFGHCFYCAFWLGCINCCEFKIESVENKTITECKIKLMAF